MVIEPAQKRPRGSQRPSLRMFSSARFSGSLMRSNAPLRGSWSAKPLRPAMISPPAAHGANEPSFSGGVQLSTLPFAGSSRWIAGFSASIQ
ncbi:MAG: hypothetical protein M5U07_16460 [Xanthobacteraceae bacterium]|nr:hypothetical protein [Xanthobacteraceae bacterium]